MNVFVTGCASHLAKTLLPLLCNDERIDKVTGIDRKPCQFKHQKFVFHQADIRDDKLSAWMTRHDALIHLAFIVLRGKMPIEEMHDVNVTASFKVFQQAKNCGIPRFIHLSSASVYGQGSNLDEKTPFSPIPGFIYAAHKAELEIKLHQHFPNILCLRPHIILGPEALPLLRFILKQPFYVKLKGPQPLLQCVHEKDVAHAILLSVFSSISGALNLASDESLSFREMININRPGAIGIPLSLVKPILKLVWQLTGLGGEPAWLDGAEHSLTLNCLRAQNELDWKPEFSSLQAIKSL